MPSDAEQHRPAKQGNTEDPRMPNLAEESAGKGGGNGSPKPLVEDLYQESLRYHRLGGRPGKLAVVPTKPCLTQRDLSLAYSPGVAEPCLQIKQDPQNVFEYTNKGNLVAVISNGTAVLGLGNIGALASKPVMEGKGVLFKRFAGIDVFDIEVNALDPQHFIETVVAIAPTFGGINLEDIWGKDCFYIEQELIKRLDIPVFHDDQHGTAVIAAAAFLNACELTSRKLKDVRLVISGAGAAGLSVARLFVRLGVLKQNILLCDSKGVLYTGRQDMEDILRNPNNPKSQFVQDTEAHTLKDALKDADCFIGCSTGNIMTPEMLQSMAKDPIVFALANPTPEIDYHLAKNTRKDVIMATGRSDLPNQINNVLGFPFIFRGALDTRARYINEEMKLAAVNALASLAKETVPEEVSKAYGNNSFAFGRDYLIPKPFDKRVLIWESLAVAKAAMDSQVARRVLDITLYKDNLLKLSNEISKIG